MSNFPVADLTPPLGNPGGTCQIVQRIDQKVKNPQVKEHLIDEVQHGEDLTNPDAAKIYTPIMESGVGFIRTIKVTSHGQYRMDLRKIKVDDLRKAVGSLVTHVEKLKKENPAAASKILTSFAMGDKIEWVDPTSKLKIVVQPSGSGTVALVSAFWKGVPDPPPETNCRVALRYLSSLGAIPGSEPQGRT